MDSATELLKKVRKIEIKTKALSHQIFAGEYHSAFKGRGMAFSEVREYQWGDDVRSMDWNVTARLRTPYVKVFEEERELTVVLLVDVSRSGLFGTATTTKREMLAEIAAVLSFSAILNNDKVGALFFSDRIEKFIPPGKGRSHVFGLVLGQETQTAEVDAQDGQGQLCGKGCGRKVGAVTPETQEHVGTLPHIRAVAYRIHLEACGAKFGEQAKHPGVQFQAGIF